MRRKLRELNLVSAKCRIVTAQRLCGGPSGYALIWSENQQSDPACSDLILIKSGNHRADIAPRRASALLPLFHARPWNRHPELNHLGDHRAHVAVQRLSNMVHLHTAAGMIAQQLLVLRSPDSVLVIHLTLQTQRTCLNVITAAH